MKRFDNASEIRRLENLGYDVFIRHLPPTEGLSVYGRERNITLVEIRDTMEFDSHIGVSVCHQNDQFNKNFGLRIALGRAMKKIGMKLV